MITFTQIARASVLATVASSFLACSVPAFAADDNQLPQGQLNVASTDFTSAPAVAHLKNRLYHLAFDICVPSHDARDLVNSDARKCVAAATADGIAQIDSRREQALRETNVNVASNEGNPHPAH